MGKPAKYICTDCNILHLKRDILIQEHTSTGGRYRDWQIAHETHRATTQHHVEVEEEEGLRRYRREHKNRCASSRS